MDDEAVRRARLDSITRRARALRCDTTGALAEEVDELRGQITALERGLSAAWEAAGAEVPPQRPALRLIEGGAA